MKYKDKRERIYEVRQGNTLYPLWSIHCFNPLKNKWWPWPCASWYESKNLAERDLKRFAMKRGWEEVSKDDRSSI
jgi:hypothetical protein